MAEYALILGGIAIVVIPALFFLGGRIRDLFQSTGSAVTTPFDEALLLIVAVPLALFYRQPLRDAWKRSERRDLGC